LRRCLEEASDREQTLSAKLMSLNKLVQSTEKQLVGQHWTNMVGEDILLSKIHTLLEEAERRGDAEVEEKTERRLKFEENMKKLLFSASKAKVSTYKMSF